MNSENALLFVKLCGLVKNIKRTGWLRYLNPQLVQSVADHSFRVAMMTMMLRNNGGKFDYRRCLEMALIHDIGQGLIGDYTPYCNISRQDKYLKQQNAVSQILQPLGEEGHEYYMSLWQQYEQHKTYESWLVKDLDKFQMIQQAYEYEQEHYKKGINLDSFYHCVKKMKTLEVRTWGEELVKKREKFLEGVETKIGGN